MQCQPGLIVMIDIIKSARRSASSQCSPVQPSAAQCSHTADTTNTVTALALQATARSYNEGPYKLSRTRTSANCVKYQVEFVEVTTFNSPVITL